MRDAESGDGARIALTIARDGAGFTGELVALDRSGKQGRRSLRGESCAEVSQTLAFLAVLAIELGGRVEPEPVAAAPAATAPPPPPVTPAKPAPRRQPMSKPAPERTWRLSALVGAGLRGGLAPSVRPAAELGFDAGATRPKGFSPSARALIVGSLSRIEHSAGAAKLSLLAGRIEGCPLRFGSSAVGFRPCLGVELGAVFARGEIEGGRSVVEPWGSAETSLRVETWLLPQLLLELSGAAVVPFFHTHYFFVPDQVIYTVPGVTGRAGLAVGYRFQ